MDNRRWKLEIWTEGKSGISGPIFTLQAVRLIFGQCELTGNDRNGGENPAYF